MRTQFRFSHRSDDGRTYYWVAKQRLPGDSRTEHVNCPVDWFWDPHPHRRTTDAAEVTK